MNRSEKPVGAARGCPWLPSKAGSGCCNRCNRYYTICNTGIVARSAPLARKLPWLLRRCALASVVGAAAIFGGCRRSEATGPNARPLHSAVFSHVEIIGSRGTGPGQFNKPRSLALDTNDNLYVVDMTGRVQKFSPEGRFLLSWQMPQTDLGKPKGMCRDREGNIVVLEPHYQRVNHFTPEGKLVAQWGVKGTNAGELTLPRSIAVDTKNNVIVSEYTLVDRVQKFSARGGRCLLAWGTPGLGPGEFNRAEGVCVDARDRIYVADSCNHRLQVFTPDGKFLRAYGKAGESAGQMSYPYDIAVDEQGRQYVCEFGNSRIQIFDANDQPIEIIGKAGGEPGEFANPWSLALDSKGNLFVADSMNHRVQKFIRSPKSKVQGTRSGRGEFGNVSKERRVVPPHPGPLPMGEGDRHSDFEQRASAIAEVGRVAPRAPRIGGTPSPDQVWDRREEANAFAIAQTFPRRARSDAPYPRIATLDLGSWTLDSSSFAE